VPNSNHWPHQLQQILSEQACVLVTVVSVKGSAPRAVGSRMIITSDGQEGSIGGGNLEYEATRTARELLSRARQSIQKKLPYGLGPALNQCCGGAVSLLFETLLCGDIGWLPELLASQDRSLAPLLLTALDREMVTKWALFSGKDLPEDIPRSLIPAISEYRQGNQSPQLLTGRDGEMFLLETIEEHRLPLLLFGAGHVARALVEELGRQPFQVSWIDSRADQFPDHHPENIEVIIRSDPCEEIKATGVDYACLVMTHSHELDEDICFAALQHKNTTWLGLIGSETKRRRFSHRLLKRGISENRLKLLICPVGMAGITGKRPATIAVSIIAQLLHDVVPANWR